MKTLAIGITVALALTPAAYGANAKTKHTAAPPPAPTYRQVEDPKDARNATPATPTTPAPALSIEERAAEFDAFLAKEYNEDQFAMIVVISLARATALFCKDTGMVENIPGYIVALNYVGIRPSPVGTLAAGVFDSTLFAIAAKADFYNKTLTNRDPARACPAGLKVFPSLLISAP